MHLQENTSFDLDLEVKVTQIVAQYPLHHVTYAAAKFEVARSKGLGGDTFARNVMGGKKKARNNCHRHHRQKTISLCIQPAVNVKFIKHLFCFYINKD